MQYAHIQCPMRSLLPTKLYYLRCHLSNAIQSFCLLIVITYYVYYYYLYHSYTGQIRISNSADLHNFGERAGCRYCVNLRQCTSTVSRAILKNQNGWMQWDWKSLRRQHSHMWCICDTHIWCACMSTNMRWDVFVSLTRWPRPEKTGKPIVIRMPRFRSANNLHKIYYEGA